MGATAYFLVFILWFSVALFTDQIYFEWWSDQIISNIQEILHLEIQVISRRQQNTLPNK